MERESFEDAATAADLNRDFVAIKVDREERPDLDQVYMARGPGDDRRRRLADERLPDARRPAVLRRHLLPGRRRATGCRRSAQVLEGVDRAWREQRARGRGGRRGALVDAARRQDQTRPAAAADDATARTLLDAATVGASRRCVRRRRTAAGAARPKFPQPMTIEFLLARGSRRPATRAALADGAAHARRDGRRRDPRPARRRLPPLRDRRRSGSSRTSSRCSTTTPSSPGSTSTPGR